MATMKIFLTGGSGYIGSVTSALLLDRGHEVTVFDNLERGHREAVDPRARLVVGDLKDERAVFEAVKEASPDAVFHFAAYALVGESMADPMLYFHNNVTGAVNLVRAMLSHGVKRIVFSSTCATYGQPEIMPMTEDLPQRPTNPYGESKLMCEKIMLWAQERQGLEPTFLRYFNACGATERLGEDHAPETHLIPNILKVALGQSEAVQLFGDDYPTADGTCVRDYIHVSDLAEAHLLALEKHALGAFNLGTGTGCSVKEVLAACCKATGRDIAHRIAPRRPGDPACLYAAAGKANRVLGWVPRSSAIDDIVQSAWAWHLAHPHGYGA